MKKQTGWNPTLVKYDEDPLTLTELQQLTQVEDTTLSDLFWQRKLFAFLALEMFCYHHLLNL